MKKIAWEGDTQIYIQRTSRLYDRIGPVGRFDENGFVSKIQKNAISFRTISSKKVCSNTTNKIPNRKSFTKKLIWSKLSKMGPKYLFYSETCVADISAREKESGKVNKIIKNILIPSYNGDIPIVHWQCYRLTFLFCCCVEHILI